MSHPERIADVAAATSGAGWIVSLAVQALPVIQALAGIVAIIAGLCAAYYHITKAKKP